MDAEKKQTSRLNSKFLEAFLIPLIAVLVFAGPTYFVLVLLRGLDLDYALSMSIGFLLFLIGFVLLVFLIKKKILS